MRSSLDKRAIAALSAGHLATDFANGALPALLPFLVAEFDLSYAAAGATMLAWAVSSSVVQPVFGIWSDRRGALWLLPVGLALGGIGIGLAAAAPSYWLVLVFVTVSGLGTAAFHPEGSKFAAFASGRRRASGMSLFSIGGNLGYALGPVAATAVVLQFGLDGGLLLALLPLAVAAGLVSVMPFLGALQPAERVGARLHRGVDRRGGMAVLMAVVALRGAAWFGLITFVPLWEVAQGASEAHGNRLLALMLFAGGVGTLAAGPVADAIGRRPVLLASVGAVGPLVLVYVLAGGVAGAVALALVGVCVIGSFGIVVVMGQEYLPRHIGLASGLTIGLAIGVGGVGAAALGAFADAVDLETALLLCALGPLVAFGVALFLPASHAPSFAAPETVVP